jgi:hypothetical protein
MLQVKRPEKMAGREFWIKCGEFACWRTASIELSFTPSRASRASGELITVDGDFSLNFNFCPEQGP